MERCNYQYLSTNKTFEVEAFMLGQERYPDWFRTAMYDDHTVRVVYNKPKSKKLRPQIMYADLNTKDEFKPRAYPYDMIIKGLVPDKLTVLSWEVFKKLFIAKE